MRRPLLLAAVILCLAAPLCRAWLRATCEDEAVVGRSDLMVIGTVKDGSVRYVPHADDGRGRSWEHQLTLSVSEVVKGDDRRAELPVTVDYGLDPIVGRAAVDRGPTSRPVDVTGPLSIHDTGNSDRGVGPILADARQPNVWLLRRGADGRYHVTDPEDVQPLARKAYLACYLSPDPEAAVRAYLQRDPAVAASATRYLAHLDVQHIADEPDPARRAERLLPYFETRQRWGTHDEAADALTACGPASGPYLLGLYERTADAGLRERVIMLWGRTRYAGATDVLVKALTDADPFWAAQHLQPGWWNDDKDPRLLAARRDSYGIVYHAVLTLAEIGDARARPAVEATRRRWAAIAFENPQIVQACDAAVARLDQKAK